VNHNTIPGAEYSQIYAKIRTYSSGRWFWYQSKAHMRVPISD